MSYSSFFLMFWFGISLLISFQTHLQFWGASMKKPLVLLLGKQSYLFNMKAKVKPP